MPKLLDQNLLLPHPGWPDPDRNGGRLAEWVHHYNWHRSHEALNGLCPIDRVCQCIDQTPLWEEVTAAYELRIENVQVRDYAAAISLRRLKPCP